MKKQQHKTKAFCEEKKGQKVYTKCAETFVNFPNYQFSIICKFTGTDGT